MIEENLQAETPENNRKGVVGQLFKELHICSSFIAYTMYSKRHEPDLNMMFDECKRQVKFYEDVRDAIAPIIADYLAELGVSAPTPGDEISPTICCGPGDDEITCSSDLDKYSLEELLAWGKELSKKATSISSLLRGLG